jgi:hypothetical protein
MTRIADDRARRIEQYATGPKRLREALAGVPPEAMKWRPASGEFSVHEIVVHCADAETIDAARIRSLTAERDPVIVAYDENEWARALDYHSHSLEAALATVDVVCAHTTALLRRLPETAWETAVGRHTLSGRYTADEWLAIESEHIGEHIKQIQGNLEAWRASRAAVSS